MTPSKFSAVVFPRKEIVQTLNELGFSINISELDKPSSDFVCKLYSDILSSFDPQWFEMDENMTFGLMEIVDNPDHHTTAIFKLHLLRKMNQFLESIEFPQIGLRDLLRPEAILTIELFSVLTNYKLYMDMKVNQAAHIVNLYPNTEVSKAVTERIQAACTAISEHMTACENEQTSVKVLENDIKKLKLNINNHNKDLNILKSKIQQLQDEKKTVDDKVSQANYELLKKSQENSKFLSMIVQSPDKVQRTLEEKKASRDEALSAEKSSMFAVKEKTLKLELFSKVVSRSQMEARSVDYFTKVFEAPIRPTVVAPHSYQWIVSNEMNAWLDRRPPESEFKEACDKMSKHLKNIQDVVEQSINVPKVLDKDIKTLKAKLIDDELLLTSLKVEIVESNRKENQILESIKAMERERDIKVADYTQKINNLKSEMEFFLHSLKEREFAADANVAKGEKLNREINMVKEKGSTEIHEFMEIHKLLSQEYAKYVDQMSAVFDKFEAECDVAQPTRGAQASTTHSHTKSTSLPL